MWIVSLLHILSSETSSLILAIISFASRKLGSVHPSLIIWSRDIISSGVIALAELGAVWHTGSTYRNICMLRSYSSPIMILTVSQNLLSLGSPLEMLRSCLRSSIDLCTAAFWRISSFLDLSAAFKHSHLWGLQWSVLSILRRRTNTCLCWFNGSFTCSLCTYASYQDFINLAGLVYHRRSWQINNAPSIWCLFLSSHELIDITYKIRIECFCRRHITVRDLRSFDGDKFLKDLDSYDWSSIYLVKDIDDKVMLFNDFLLGCYNQHALCTISLKHLPSPWISAKIKARMSETGRAEDEKKEEQWKTMTLFDA